MAKNNALKNRQTVEEFDFSEMMEGEESEAMAGIMCGLIEASQHQATMAIELTKLVVGKKTGENTSEDDIYSIFNRALEVVAESFPMKALWEKFKE